MTNHELMDETDEGSGMWLVRLPNGGVRAVTLEQLDDAYQRDWINGDTEVMEDGATAWRKLSELIGEQGDELKDEILQDDDEPTTAYAAYPTQIHAVPSPYYVPATHPAAAEARASQHAERYAPPTRGYPVGAPGPKSLPDYSATAYPVQAARSPVSTQRLTEVRSTAPVASDIYDIDLDLGATPFKRKGRGALALVAVGVLAIGGVVAAIAGTESAPASGVVVAAAAHSAAPVPFKPTPLPELETPAKPAKPSSEARLSDDMKRALTEADKLREKSKSAKGSSAKAKQRTAGSSRGHSTERSVFTKGGDSHDPLNGSL